MERIDFSGLSQFSNDDVDKVLATSSQGGKYLEEGQHEVEIISIDLSKRAKDPTWINSKINFMGVGDKTANGFLLIPTSKLTYGDKETALPLINFNEFINALQVNKPWDFICKNMNFILDQLVGKCIKITLGHQKGSYVIRYVEKDKYVVVDPSGNNLKENNKDIIFPSKDAAKAELMGSGDVKRFSEFMSILNYSQSKEKNVFKFGEEKRKTSWG